VSSFHCNPWLFESKLHVSHSFDCSGQGKTRYKQQQQNDNVCRKSINSLAEFSNDFIYSNSGTDLAPQNLTH